MSISAQFDAGLWEDNFGDLSAPEQRDLLCAASWDLCRLLQQLRDGTVASQQAACHALISVTGNLGYLHCAHALRRIDQRWIAGDVMTGAHLRHAVDALCLIGAFAYSVLSHRALHVMTYVTVGYLLLYLAIDLFTVIRFGEMSSTVWMLLSARLLVAVLVCISVEHYMQIEQDRLRIRAGVRGG